MRTVCGFGGSALRYKYFVDMMKFKKLLGEGSENFSSQKLNWRLN